jgi:cell wall-associated NlpC family hydrolase
MKKYVMVASAVLTLAGCTASIAIADVQKALSTTGNAVKETTVSKGSSFNTQSLIKKAKFNTQSLIKKAKRERNTARLNEVIKYLKSRVGETSYVFSGSSPRGWDCSGLVKWTYERFANICPKENIFIITNEIYSPKI